MVVVELRLDRALTGSNKSLQRMLRGTSCGFGAGHGLGCCAWGVSPALGAVSVSLPCDDELSAALHCCVRSTRLYTGRCVRCAGLVAQLVRAHA